MKLAKMKVVEMRKELDARGLNSSGTRPTLMKRLREALNREEEEKALEEKALEQKTDEPPKPEQSRQSEKDQMRSKEDDGKTPSPRPSVVTPSKEATDVGNLENSSPREEVAAASEEQAPTATQQAAPALRTDKPVASGAIGHSSELSLDERMQKRLERFGAAKDVPDTTKDAIQKRRKRFGTADKDQEEKPAKRRRPSKEVDEQVLKEHEEAKKRRAIKFGTSLNTTTKEPAAPSGVSADEMEKRLRRQRRFQQVGY